MKEEKRKDDQLREKRQELAKAFSQGLRPTVFVADLMRRPRLVRPRRRELQQRA